MKTNLSHKRHIAKAFTWRAIASCSTFLIGWVLTGDMTLGIKFGIADVIIKLILYYGHERLWYKSDFGVSKSSDKHMHMPTLTKGSNICMVCGKEH